MMHHCVLLLLALGQPLALAAKHVLIKVCGTA
jgi:hypothetical protein